MSETKTWTTPKLVVLDRVRPEESVLMLCKGTGVESSKESLYSLCHASKGATYCANPCNGMAQS